MMRKNVQEINKKERNKMENEVKIRFAQKQDTKTILGFIKELAEYENMLDDVVATEELLEEWKRRG